MAKVHAELNERALERLQSALVMFSQRAFYLARSDVPAFREDGMVAVFYNKESGMYFLHPSNVDNFQRHMIAAGLIPTSYDDDGWLDDGLD